MPTDLPIIQQIPPWPNVSVVVLTKDRPKQLGLCLWSLVKMEYPAAVEILVVNDNTKGALLEAEVHQMLHWYRDARGGTFKILGGQGTVGMAKARNIGIEAASYDWILKLDDDHYCDSDLLLRLMEHGKKDVGAIGAVFPFVYNNLPKLEVVESPKYVAKYDESTGTFDEKSHEFSQLLPMMGDEPIEADLLRGIYVHRKLPDIRFDETLSKVSHTEDTRFSWAIKCAGYKLVVAPRAMCWHFQAKTGGARYRDADIQRQRDNLSLQSYMSTTWKNRTVRPGQ